METPLTQRHAALAGLLLGVSLSACSSTITVRTTRVFASADVPLNSIVVVPFANLSKSKQAAHTITSAVVHELHRSKSFDVMEAPPRQRGGNERWTASQLGTQMKADAVLTGTVTAFSYENNQLRGRSTETPTIVFDARLVSSKSGEILWAAAFEAKKELVFTYDSIPIEQLAQQAAERVAQVLVQMAGRG